MKNKIVLWGTNEADERILVALELKIEGSKVLLYTFPEAIATDDFYKMMMDQWRDSKEESSFPEGHQVMERELSITESLLPESVKVERTDIIKQAQTEWHFVILSSKLSEAYRNELSDIKDTIASLKKYDKDVWNSLKNFWEKVQVQLRDRTIMRDHADALRNGTNKAFEEMKAMRSTMEEGFKKTSSENMDKFNSVIDDVENRIKENKHLAKIFEELKKVQKDIRGFDFTREHRNKLWNRVDKAFKDVKTKRFGEQATANEGNGPLQRTTSRYNGLMNAIDRMEKSIGRDENELAFQARQIDRTDGQLEAQIRQAKLQMIEQRVGSKREKMEDMLKTKVQLEERMAKEKEREAKRKEKQEMDAARAAAKKEAKEKIAENIKEKQAAIGDDDALKIAAEAINEQKGAKKKSAPKAKPAPESDKEKTAAPPPEAEENMLSAIAATIGESLEDVVDTIKAVAEVVGDQIEEKAEAIKQDFNEVKDEVKKDIAAAKAKILEEEE